VIVRDNVSSQIPAVRLQILRKFNSRPDTSEYLNYGPVLKYINPLTPELNPSAQRCLSRFFTGDFASWTVHFVNICVKNQQMQHYSFSLLIMYGISYVFRYYFAILRERS
jgi:hypothetical protein